ncbi:N-acetyltransferase [Paucibacter sp. APW11]|uniref:N-acetyltransferase n=1 Tax=Roseateles aquae TaxID=3077235 RepID=A0ABU3PFX4_9BURK|nr:N-acetyltransferase [Paucibacter sp. APW11]MDT9001436.1 N-acetyltransferase [Paucibacter sp. APW11]
MSEEDLVLREWSAPAVAASALATPGFTQATFETFAKPLEIKAAVTPAVRERARDLVGRKYRSRGYMVGQSQPSLPGAEPVTLTALKGEEVIGTLSVRFDGDAGLAADAVFADELAAMRESGHKLCECTQFAIDGDEASRHVQLNLFQAAYLAAYRLRGARTLVVEVNPRHVGFYRRMLGFKICSGERMNPRVNAPAVLMSLDFCWAQQQLARYAGQPALARVARNLFPCFQSVLEERRMLEALARDIGSVH